MFKHNTTYYCKLGQHFVRYHCGYDENGRLVRNARGFTDLGKTHSGEAKPIKACIPCQKEARRK